MEKLEHKAPYDLDMSKEQFVDLWKRAHTMVIYKEQGAQSIPVQRFKVHFAKANNCTSSELFIDAFLSACNKDQMIMAEYINKYLDDHIYNQ